MRRLPAWLKILTVLLPFLLLAAAALFVVATGEVPSHAKAEAIQARFPVQIGLLGELARTFPLDACPQEGRSPAELLRDMTREFPPVLSPDHGTPDTTLLARIEALRTWTGLARDRSGLFSDGAILGAKVVLFCPGGSASVDVSDLLGKPHREPSLMISRAMLETPTEWPVVSLWYHQGGRIVLYEDRVEEPTGSAKGFQLILDLEGLAPAGGPANA